MRNVKSNPFYFKLGDLSKDVAPSYYPPKKRREIKDHLTKTSIRFN